MRIHVGMEELVIRKALVMNVPAQRGTPETIVNRVSDKYTYIIVIINMKLDQLNNLHVKNRILGSITPCEAYLMCS